MSDDALFDEEIIHAFLTHAEPTLRREVALFSIQTLETLRAHAGSLSMAECMHALENENISLRRDSIRRRLKQRIAARASEIVAEYLDNLD